MHRILVNQIVIDVPDDQHDAVRDFWGTALAARVRRSTIYPEYHVLEGAAARQPIAVQNIGTTLARVHFDLETDDVAAEVFRLLKLGAVEAYRHDDWVVLADPAGLLFCVVPAEAPDFAERSVEVSD